MNRTDILDGARSAVCGDRDHDYGGPEKSFECIAEMWTSFLRYSKPEIGIATLTASDVAAMMCMLKLARIAKNPAKMDSWVDLAGYSACGGECASVMDAVREEEEARTMEKRCLSCDNYATGAGSCLMHKVSRRPNETCEDWECE